MSRWRNVGDVSRTTEPIARGPRALGQLAVLTLIAAIALIATAAGPVSSASAAIKMADAFLVDATGLWFCPPDKPHCPSPRYSANELVSHLGNQPNLYMRVAKARNDCKYG